MVNGDLTRYPGVGCPWGARTGEPRAKAGVRYCEPGWGPTKKKAPYITGPHPLAHSDGGLVSNSQATPLAHRGFFRLRGLEPGIMSLDTHSR